jgi:Uma2 family endonuclease
MAAKVAEYLATGTQVVWVVDPEERTIIVHRRGAPSTTLGINDTLDGGVVLPEFACRVSEIFDTLV